MPIKTVWSKDSMPLVPPRFRPIYTVALPIIDAIIIGFALVAIIVGSRVVADFTLEWFPYLWAAEVGTGATLASIGLIFCLNWIELIGKGFLVIGFATYAVLLGINVDGGSTSTLLSIALIGICLVIILTRVGDLIGQIGQKQVDESSRRRAAQAKGRHV